MTLLRRFIQKPAPRMIVRLLWFGLIILIAAWQPTASADSLSDDKRSDPIKLRVQLQWSDQAQFAGLYMAQSQKLFEQAGLKVELIAGGANTNPIKQLQENRADIAIAWLDNAWQRSNPSNSVTNVAQIFDGSALRLVCRPSLGIQTPKDLANRKIGIWGIGDKSTIKAMLLRYGVAIDDKQFVEQRPDAQDLISGSVGCATVMNYNEYWTILNSGISQSDLLVLNPQNVGVPHIEDGVYVLTQRLSSAQFRDALVKLLRATREGWRLAQQLPDYTLNLILASYPHLDRDRQQHILTTVLPMIPASDLHFGKFNLSSFDQVVAARKASDNKDVAPANLWTHQIWSELRAQDGDKPRLAPSTQHYIENAIKHAPAFKALLILGVLTFALTGLLEAVSLGYDLWGRLVLAAVACLGGGTLRDFLIGGDRLPPSYVNDPVPTTIVLLVVLIGTIVTSIYKDFHKTKAFARIKLTTDIFGFSALALVGALYCIAAGLPWRWAPVCAALTCTGGGMLRDIVINREPRTFKGTIYEEVAVVGAIILLIGLAIADEMEQSPVGVYLSIIVCFVSMIAMRVLVHHYKITYPSWLTGRKTDQ